MTKKVSNVPSLDELVLELCHVETPEDLFITNPEFWAEFCTRAVDVNIKPGKSVAKIQKALFKICHEIAKTRYTQTDPDNIRHADLTALFMFNFWNAMGLLPMTQAVLILSSEIL
jgi:hypothetical protein